MLGESYVPVKSKLQQPQSHEAEVLVFKIIYKICHIYHNLDKYCNKQNEIEASIQIPHCYVWRSNSPCPGGLKLSNYPLPSRGERHQMPGIHVCPVWRWEMGFEAFN